MDRNSRAKPAAAQPTEAAVKANEPASTAGPRRIRVLVADDHPVVRKGLLAYLERQTNMEIVGEAVDGQEALRKSKELMPDVILMDMDMPRLNGLVVTQTLRQEVPNVKVLIVSADASSEFMMRIIQSGARGHILKDAPPEDLVQAILRVESGEGAFGSDFARLALSKLAGGEPQGPDLSKLTKREVEVLVEIAKGYSNKEIGCHLNIGTRTVETHRENLMEKLQIHSAAGLTRFAFAHRLVTLRE
jgi:two-component system, NarL family, nitrate/nitrite response regulator NarL